MSALQLRLETNDGGEPWIIEQKIFNLLNDYLQPHNSTLTPAAAAQELNSLFPLNRVDEAGEAEKEEPESFLWEMWGVVIQVAKQTPWKSAASAHEKLAEFIKALRDLPSETTVPIWGSDSKIWQDLPLLGPNLVEAWEALDVPTLTNAAADRVEERQGLQNFNAFEARLTRDGTCDCRMTAVWALKEALEQEPDPRNPAYHRQGPVLDCFVPVAAEWISIAGQALLDGGHKDYGGAGDGGRLWKGKRGFSPERWQFWKERFGVISEHEQVSDETKQVAREAKDRMTKIENESKGMTG
ncbi:MAG: hypothetical protein M1816_000616 [Peltula sp. TS41687]|nr:MAG: hypothetical protein M1816_000616 [Peltula sp. TS41687]